MMRNKTPLVALLSITLLTGLGNVAMAQNGYHGQNRANPQGINQGLGHQPGYRANLTAEQQAISQKAFDAFQLKTADIRQQLLSKNYEYRALLTSKPLDEQKVLAVSKEITALRDNMYQQRVALDTELAKAGIPAMGHRGGMNGAGMHSGRGCR